jgi:hypothetical protein
LQGYWHETGSVGKGYLYISLYDIIITMNTGSGSVDFDKAGSRCVILATHGSLNSFFAQQNACSE